MRNRTVRMLSILVTALLLAVNIFPLHYVEEKSSVSAAAVATTTNDSVANADSIETGIEIPRKSDVAEGVAKVTKDDDQIVESQKEQAEKELENSKNAKFREDTLTLKVADQVGKSAAENQENLLNKLKNYHVTKLEPLFTVHKKSGESDLEGESSSSKAPSTWYKATLEADTDVISTLQELLKEEYILSAEPDYVRELKEVGQPTVITDPKMAEQYYFDKLGIKKAWDYLGQQNISPGGKRDVVVAVIDTGVDYTHPDLTANMWTNTAEIAGNGIDDDKNGYKDDIYGASIQGGTKSGDPRDDNGHGTHVAGIVAAAANNGVGGVGVAYNVKIMAIKAGQASGVFSASDIAAAIYYAADKGADVINMSYGGYGKSTLEEDALQVAYGTSVLVAAAGNDSYPNEGSSSRTQMYPAAYPWVLGVMAERPTPAANGDNLANFSNWDVIPENVVEYEVMAPGVDIFSTLPGGNYAKWSGTSMAAPVVSGIAALVRSKFSDKNVYSSRFIMGQLASTGELKQGITYDPKKDPIYYHEVNAYSALTSTPKPHLSYMESYLFDSKSIDANNNEDGIIDAGETINIAAIIRNHWGKADNVQVKLDTNSSVGIPDPYVSFVTDTVDYGAVGNFGTDDNGLIYTNNVITGVKNPFVIKVAANTPNDHVIQLNMTLTGKNGFNSNDQAVYSSEDSITFTVRNAKTLPRVISQNMTLTNDGYWLIPDKTLIEKGVTVTVEPGTKLQFWSTPPSDPYAEQQMPYLQVEGELNVQGTASEPVEMFTGLFYRGYQIKISATNGGKANISYAKIANPVLDVTTVDHSYFYQEHDTSIYYTERDSNGKIRKYGYRSPRVAADSVSSSRFYKLGYLYQGNSVAAYLKLKGQLSNNLLDSCMLNADTDYVVPDIKSAQDNVFLKNYRTFDVSGQKNYVVSIVKKWTDNTFQNNAILNDWSDPNVDHWMRFYSFGDRSFTRYLQNNYWGTASKELIDKAIVDYNDDFNTAKIVYEPILTTAPATAYPFVVDAYVSTSTQERAQKVGAERVTFHVAFNRDMNQNIQPQVSFGSDVPVTDYAVKGSWVDARNWEGSFDINPITGDGYQFIRVAGAVAADDPWLVTGNDTQRFKFEVLTSGAESMKLQASGAEGKVQLSWAQDDFTLLAGYNLYRSESATGTFTKINSTIIPAGQSSYDDKNVVPGKTYYYKFTVVQTDLNESDYSNVASAAPIDTVAPVISHTPVKGANVGLPLQIFADVTDNVGVQGVSVYYRKTGTTNYAKLDMVKTTGNRYSAVIDGANVTAPGVEYYIEATDGNTIARQASASSPNNVAITDAPKISSLTPAQGPDSGGTKVIISGTNFKQGAKVAFDGTPASDVVVESDSRITAVSPTHIPATVDVSVTNTDGFADTLLKGFNYTKTGVDISIPNAQANTGASVEIPINISNVSGLTAADLTVSYDSSLLSLEGAKVGTLTSGFTISVNKNTPGTATLSMASSNAVNGSGAIAYLQFKVLSSTKVSSALTVQSANLNGGSIQVNTLAGTFTVSQAHSISGFVYYYYSNKPVPNFNVSVTGGIPNNTYTSSSIKDGSYVVQNVPDGDFVLKANKSNDATDITSYDASLILQASAGTLALSANQKLAADVNNDGKVNSMDAAYVLKRAAGMIELPFPGAGKVWKTVEGDKTYNSLTNDLYKQNLTAILIGDVSGNWGSSSDPTVQSNSRVEFHTGNVKKETDGTISLPVVVNVYEGKIFASDIVINYDAASLSPTSVDKTSLSNNFTFAYNTSMKGTIKVSMAGGTPITAAGELMILRFKPIDSKSNLTGVKITDVQVNEGAIQSLVVDRTLPIISGVSDVTITTGSTFDPKAGVKATDDVDGDLTSQLQITEAINMKVPGIYTITYTVSDKSNNTTTLTRKVTVVDKTLPIISGASDLTVATGSSFDVRAGVKVTDDVDGDITSQLQISGTINTKVPGVYTITYKASDKAKNTSTVTRKVTVVDQTLPVISGVGNVTVGTGSTFDVKAGVKVTDDVDGDLTSKLQITGTVNTKIPGVYTITYTVSDKAKNTNTVTRKVTIVDKTLPVISGASDVTVGTGSTFDLKAGVKATDDVDGDLTSQLQITEAVNMKVPGIYTITYTVSDKSNNTAKVTRKVTIVDKTLPVISGASDVTVVTGSIFDAKAGVKVMDDVDGDLTSQLQITGTVNMKVPGMYTITYKVSDKAKNTSTLTRRVTVVDKTLPVISGAGDVTVGTGSTFDAKAGVKVTDDVDGDLTSKLQITGTLNTKVPGVYTITYTVSDKAKNTSTVTRKVTVVDKTLPVISGASDVTVGTGSTFDVKAGIKVTDDVDGDITTQLQATGTVNTKVPGIYTITYNVVDKANNIGAIMRKVTVVDKTLPLFSGTSDLTITTGSSFDPKADVKVTDDVDGDLTNQLQVTGTVNTKVPGVYTITYKVSDKAKNTTTVTRKVTVVDKTLPVISGASEIEIKTGSTFNAKAGIKAVDDVDGDLTSKLQITGTVNTKVPGVYILTYIVSDKAKNVCTITRRVKVV